MCLEAVFIKVLAIFWDSIEEKEIRNIKLLEVGYDIYGKVRNAKILIEFVFMHETSSGKIASGYYEVEYDLNDNKTIKQGDIKKQ